MFFRRPLGEENAARIDLIITSRRPPVVAGDLRENVGAVTAV